LRAAAGRAAAARHGDNPDEQAAPPRRFDGRWLLARLRSLAGPLRGQRFCLALSGGLDSSVLLEALARLRRQAGFRLRALHIDHGLHAASAQWATAARSHARALRVPCEIVRVRVRRARGESLEAVARHARYGALLARLGDGELLLTAHHQDDQLETLLLALLRGSGVRGLAAMAPCTAIGGARLMRPLLPVSRLQLERYARARGLAFSEDPSNADERFDRNYLRRQVLPRVRLRWPAAAVAGGRAAAHLAEAQALLDAAARHAVAAAADGAALRASRLRLLPAAERRNALRYWLGERGLPLPDHRRLREMSGPLLAARADSAPLVRWQGGELRRFGDRLLAQALPAHTVPARLPRAGSWNWRRQSWLPLGPRGRLGMIADRHGDVDLASLPCPLRIRFRRGGERLRTPHGSVPLKDLLQQRGIAPWQRTQVPLLYARSHIVAVADLWLDTAYRAGAHSSGARGRLRWRQAVPETNRD
jgi:tRNA(Ile)-lysidine synthase